MPTSSPHQAFLTLQMGESAEGHKPSPPLSGSETLGGGSSRNRSHFKELLESRLCIFRLSLVTAFATFNKEILFLFHFFKIYLILYPCGTRTQDPKMKSCQLSQPGAPQQENILFIIYFRTSGGEKESLKQAPWCAPSPQRGSISQP